MSARKRFYGPVLTAVGSQSAFAGTEEKERMDLVRNAIYNVRTKWRKLEEHEFLRTQIREFTERQPTRHPPELRAELDRLLQHFNDYADMDHGGELPVTADASSFTALEIYCSKDGYEYLYSLISKLLRAREVDPQQLITAATLVEYLTIELYNLRLSNIGHDMYANYQGIVYRGMSVATAAAEDFRKIANNPNLAERNFAIPLALISSTTDVKTMEKFAATDPTKEQMHWTIHIHGLDPVLLDRYLQKYPSSVVTSLCAMPIAGISPLGEKEILLRGPFFHIIHMASELGDDKRIIHKLEVVMLNSNRDHGTELGSNEGEKGQQRAFFNRIIKASRYEICASLAEKYSIEDARGYERLMQETLAQIDADDVRQPTVSTGLAEARSSGVATWLGASCSCTFPRHHASRRKKWQEAAGTGDWETIESILQDNYEWHRTEWLNAIELTGTCSALMISWKDSRPNRNRAPAGQSSRWPYIATQDGHTWTSPRRQPESNNGVALLDRRN